MTDNTPALVALAGTASEHFQHRTREDGTEYVSRTDDAPDWIADLCYAAHGSGDFLPDDYRYAWTLEALHVIAEACEEDELEDLAHDFANDMTPYTSERIAWLASNLTRTGYCDDAAREYGFTVEDSGGVDGLLGLGIYAERYEVFTLVARYLERHSEAQEVEDV